LNPIHVLPEGEKVEWKDYWKSWMGAKMEDSEPEPVGAHRNGGGR
jgi:hypothetical protein